MADGQVSNPLQAGQTALASIDQARGLLLGGGDEEKPAQQPAQAQEQAQPNGAQPGQQDSAQAEAAPAETQPSGETEGAEPAEGPPIEPPTFWQKADREDFKNLPRAIQQRIVDREQARDTEVRRVQNEAADKRKAAEAETLAAQNERQRYQQQLQPALQALQQGLANEFPDIKTVADIQKMADDRPDLYARWRAKMDVIQFTQAHQRQLNEQAAQEQRKQFEEVARAEWGELVKAKPEYKDRAKWDASRKELRDYATSLGYSEQDFDSNIAHRHFIVLEKAMLFDRAQATLPAAIRREVPKVQVPGTAQTKADQTADARAARLKRLDQTGDIDDARGLLRK